MILFQQSQIIHLISPSNEFRLENKFCFFQQPLISRDHRRLYKDAKIKPTFKEEIPKSAIFKNSVKNLKDCSPFGSPKLPAPIPRQIKFYDSPSISLEFISTGSLPSNSEIYKYVIDSESGFIAAVDFSCVYIWNYKPQEIRRSESSFLKLRFLNEKPSSSHKIPFFSFVGIYDDPINRKGELDIGAVICTERGSVHYWTGIRYNILNTEKSRSFQLDLLPDEYVINFSPIIDAQVYTVFTNKCRIFHFNFVFKNNDCRISSINSQDISPSATFFKSSIFSAIKSSIFPRKQSPNLPIDQPLDYFSLVSISSIQDELTRRSVPVLSSAHNLSINNWVYRKNHNESALEFQSSINVDNLLLKFLQNKKVDFVWKQIECIHLLGCLERFAALLKVNYNNGSAGFMFLLASTVPNNQSLEYLLLNRNFIDEETVLKPSVAVSKDQRVFFISVGNSIYSVFDGSTGGDCQKPALTLNSINFRKNISIYGIGQPFFVSGDYQILIYLKDRGGVSSLTLKNPTKKFNSSLQNSDFWVSHVSEFLKYGSEVPSQGVLLNPVSFDVRSYINTEKIDTQLFGTVAKLLSNSIIDNKLSGFEFPESIDLNLNIRISFLKSLNSYFESQGLIAKFEERIKNNLIHNFQKILSANDIWASTRSESQDSVANSFLLEDLLLDAINQVYIKHSIQFDSKRYDSMEYFFLFAVKYIEEIFLVLKSAIRDPILDSSDLKPSNNMTLEINSLFLLLTSSSTNFQNRFNTSIVSPFKNSHCQSLWSNSITYSELFTFSFKLFNITFNILNLVSVGSFPTVSDLSLANMPKFKKAFSILEIVNPSTADHEVSYSELLEKGVFKDINFMSDNIELKSIQNQSEDPLLSHQKNRNKRTSLIKNKKLQILYSHLLQLANMCFLFLPSALSEGVTSYNESDDILCKLTLMGYVGTSIKYALQFQDYEFVAKIILATEDVLLDSNRDPKYLIENCVLKYREKFSAALLKLYSRLGRYYSILSFPTSNFVPEIEVSAACDNKNETVNTVEEGGDSQSSLLLGSGVSKIKYKMVEDFFYNNSSLDDGIRQFKWIFDISNSLFNNAETSLISNIESNNCGSQKSYNELSTAKIIKLAESGLPAHLNQIPDSSDYLAVNGLFNMNKCISKFVEALKVQFPSTNSPKLLFDVDGFCKSSSTKKSRNSIESIDKSYYTIAYKLGNSKNINVFEFLFVLLRTKIPVNIPKDKSVLSISDGEESYELWFTIKRYILTAKIIENLEHLLVDREGRLYSTLQKSRSKIIRVKAYIFSMFWLHVYMLDDWNYVGKQSPNDLNSTLMSTQLYSLLRGLKYENLLECFISPKELLKGFQNIVFEDSETVDELGVKTKSQVTDPIYDVYYLAGTLFDHYQTVFKLAVKTLSDTKLYPFVSTTFEIANA
ncbi:hypothetical protein BB560_000334 [Smittium megazygosporum]|uniref:Uncharacterized protein n=1 Tax=Smittium megazygosporum TaxID=133381 RepID=A0A2T9ZKN2_9FUNG|nr:hypothetical protein BB560_000334 [Smittium megazygosporum]